MITTSEAKWYEMMGLTKTFLRNFVIACFLLTITTITTLASILNKVNQERLKDERSYRLEIAALNKRCEDMAEAKNIEYIKMLREALENQRKLDKDFEEMKHKYKRK